MHLWVRRWADKWLVDEWLMDERIRIGWVDGRMERQMSGRSIMSGRQMGG